MTKEPDNENTQNVTGGEYAVCENTTSNRFAL